MSIPKEKIKKILILRPDAIGDLVLITPAIHALRQHFPQAHIAILVQKYTSDLVKIHPDIDEVILDDIRDKKINNLKDYFNYVKKIRAKNFDLAIDFYSFDYRYPLMMLLARIPYRIGDKSRIMLRPFYNLGTTLQYKDYTKHMVDFHLELLKKIGVKADNPRLNIHIPPEVINKFKTRLQELGISDSDWLVGIHPGCGASRKWDSKGYAELCDTLQERYGAKVVITGGPREKEKAAEIYALSKKKPLNLVEKTSLSELTALIKRFNLYIGVDTGPIHLAAAIGTPVVMLVLAKNVKAVRWGPWKTSHQIIYPHPEAACPIYCDPGKCQDSYCTDKLTVSKIMAAVEQLRNNQSQTIADWHKLVFNVLIIYDQANQTQAQEVAQKLQKNGYYCILQASEQIKGIKYLLKLIETENILILHHLGKKALLTTRLANLLSGIYTTNATVMVMGFKPEQDILAQYETAFQKSLF